MLLNNYNKADIKITAISIEQMNGVNSGKDKIITRVQMFTGWSAISYIIHKTHMTVSLPNSSIIVVWFSVKNPCQRAF